MAFMFTQAEIEELLQMLKASLTASISFPGKGRKESFKVKSLSSRDVFDIFIYRGSINAGKMNVEAVVEKNNVVLLELHINASNKHVNPDGTVIIGSHWHVFSEKFGRSQAFPADDIHDDAFVENTIKFLDRFNVIEKPNIQFQFELL